MNKLVLGVTVIITLLLGLVIGQEIGIKRGITAHRHRVLMMTYDCVTHYATDDSRAYACVLTGIVNDNN